MFNQASPIALGQFIKDNFIIPSGKSMSFWGNTCGLDPEHLRRILTKDKKILLPKITRLSEVFDIPVRELIKIQNKYLLHCYQQQHKGDQPLKRIEPRQPRPLVVDILVNEFLQPNNLTFRDLAKAVNLTEATFWLRLSSSTEDATCEFSGRLGDAFGTGPKFWLDLRAKQDLTAYLCDHPYMSKYFDWNPATSFQKNELARVTTRRPGQILENDFLKPSHVPTHCWAEYFCVRPETLQRILAGKDRMDFRFISLIVKIFNTTASYWINLQNDFLSRKYLREDAPRNKVQRIIPKKKPRPLEITGIGKILINDFFRPLNITPTEFGRYLTGTKHTGRLLVFGDQRMDARMAVKVSQALGTSPMYWLDLQMEDDLARIKKYPAKRTDGFLESNASLKSISTATILNTISEMFAQEKSPSVLS